MFIVGVCQEACVIGVYLGPTKLHAHDDVNSVVIK